ncbi:MAG: DUF971 domain-containing protein [Spirochaetaceae bacterium]|nr:MAG: DUF971 domain-containing protein [Spirochaetaceae bacterium]
MSVDRTAVLEALRAVKDGESGHDISSLGLVRDIHIEDGNVSVGIELTSLLVADSERIQREASAAVAALPGVRNQVVTVSGFLRKRKLREKQSGLEKVKFIIAVASGKGGVGKSTVTAALARELSQRGYRVGLLDTDLFGPSIPSLFETAEVTLQANEREMVVPIEIDGLKLMSFGFWLGDSPAIMRGPMVTRYVNQFLHEVDWDELDYLLMDLPPGTGDIQLTLTQATPIDGAVIVTTPHALSYADVGKAVLMFDKVNVPILGVVENMASFTCPDCGSTHYLFGKDAGDRIATRFGTQVIAQLPIDAALYGASFRRSIENPAMRAAANRMISRIGAFAQGIDKPQVSYDEHEIRLHWPGSGETISVANHRLRSNCQCAVCVDEFSGTTKLDPATIPADIQAQEIKPLGNYALYIRWSDGHQSGFFPYPLIRSLAETSS